MTLRSNALVRYAFYLLLLIGLPTLAIETSALIRSGTDRAAELRVAERIGATIERPSAGVLLGHSAQPLVVTSIAAGGPARSGGLEVGDVILAAGARPVRSLGELAHALQDDAQGPFTVDRHGRRFQMMLRTRGRPSNDAGGASVP
jgi:S1-C subfamily serine protease